jgi:D-alanyl-lipoteichoic acid acyltransferase DltB (MBOAT superfamily)
MLFNSIDFAIFFPITFLLYWTVSKHLVLRNTLILIASYFFYAQWDARFLALIIISSFVDYYVGQNLPMVSRKKRKTLLCVSFAINLGFLFYFKYASFFVQTFVDAFTIFGQKLNISTLNIILPVGISFYTFQTLSYTIDIYRGNIMPTKSKLAFFSFVAFFPQLVAGPIERASSLLPQFLVVHKFNYNKVKSGLLMMALGLFKKMVIADKAAVIVNQVYNNPNDHGGLHIVFATLLFAFQIYCDFSGYSDIAIGASRTMGFRLMKNFDTPYFSKSITEFWRRWHISLSTWFKDYVYIPLGGNRAAPARVYSNLFLVFVISGLWHGAAFGFIIWGALHGFIIVLEKHFSSARNRFFGGKRNRLRHIIGIPVTFLTTSFAWVFFRSNSIQDATQIISNVFKKPTSPVYSSALEALEIYSLITFIALLLVFEVAHKRFKILRFLNSQIFIFRWSLYFVIIYILILFGIYGENQASEFIYFQF